MKALLLFKKYNDFSVLIGQLLNEVFISSGQWIICLNESLMNQVGWVELSQCFVTSTITEREEEWEYFKI